MYNILYIQHSKVTNSILEEIVKVKTVAWDYSFKEHYEWININLKSSDIHVLLYHEKTLLAYLNLIDIEVKVDGIDLMGYGVGNVCAIEKGKGWGKELIRRVNKYLSETNKIGLLFCKEKLKKFYSENDWKLLDKDKAKISKIISDESVFVFNIASNYSNLQYDGIFF